MWGTDSRKRTSTPQHRAQRLRILARDNHQCQLRYSCCIGRANEMDHEGNHASGGSDADANMQAVCRPCHLRKSSAEGHQAQAIRRARLKLPVEDHPGDRRRRATPTAPADDPAPF